MDLAWTIFQVFVVFDTTQSVSSAVLRGSGQQKIGSYITMSAYWIFGIPLAYVLSIVYDYGIQGLWVGPTVAVAYNTLMYSILINRMDWDKLIED